MSIGPDFTPGARTVIDNMSNKLHDLDRWFGRGSKEYIDALRSYANVMTSLIRLGGSVAPDGELDLICQNEYIVYGVNWSPSAHFNDAPDPGTWSVNS